MIAKTILGKKDELSFEDFIQITEGSSIDFQQFIRLVDLTAKRAGVFKMNAKEIAEAKKAYDEVADGVVFDDDDEEAAGGSSAPQQPQTAAGGIMNMVTNMAPPLKRQNTLPPGFKKLACGTCKKHFGVPETSMMARCPHCQTVNNTGGTGAAAAAAVMMPMQAQVPVATFNPNLQAGIQQRM